MHFLRGRAVSTLGAPCRPPLMHNAPNAATTIHSNPPHVESENLSDREIKFTKLSGHKKSSQRRQTKANRYIKNQGSETKYVLLDDIQASRELLFSLSMYRPLEPLERYV